MSDNNQTPPAFVPKNNGQAWVVYGTRHYPFDLHPTPEQAEFFRTSDEEIARGLRSPEETDEDVACHVAEVFVQTAEARAEQMRRLAKAIDNAGFGRMSECREFASEIAEILGLGERWYYEACGVDPDEMMAEGKMDLTLTMEGSGDE